MMTRNDRIQIAYTLTFATPFHCGTGLRVGLVDRTIVRDHNKYLYVPGSTIKGVLRERCEQVARLYEEQDGEELEDMLDAIASPHDEKRALWEPGQAPTMITRIFGSHNAPGRLFFDDARQDQAAKKQYDTKERGIKGQNVGKGKYKASQVDLYTQMRMDRPTRTAARGALYTSEFGIRELTFQGQISGWLACTPIGTFDNDPTYSLLLLLTGLHLLDQLGGNKSTGKGQCQCEITELKYRDTIFLQNQWHPWLERLDELSYYSTVQEENT